MRTALDAAPEILDPHETKFVGDIRKHGWIHTSVFADDKGPGFTFTTGFWLTLAFPEILVFSMKKEQAHDIYWHMFRQIRNGHVFELAKPIGNVLVDLDVVLIPLPAHQLREYCGWSRWFYGGDAFQCVQLVWPDAKGFFPWQPGADPSFANSQPDLTEAAWGGLDRP